MKNQDLIGVRFGNFTIIEINKSTAICQCDCTNIVKRKLERLKSGRTSHCGCKNEEIHKSYEKSFVGKQINDLKVLELVGLSDKNRRLYKCECVCGKIIEYDHIQLSNNKKSCGCFYKGSRHPKWSGYEDISGSYFRRIRRGAQVRNLEFDITLEDMWDLFVKQEKRCAISNIPLTLQSSYRIKQTASLDRISPSLGYIKDNIQWVHKDINTIKFDFSEKELFRYIKDIYEFKSLNNIVDDSDKIFFIDRRIPDPVQRGCEPYLLGSFDER